MFKYFFLFYLLKTCFSTFFAFSWLTSSFSYGTTTGTFPFCHIFHLLFRTFSHRKPYIEVFHIVYISTIYINLSFEIRTNNEVMIC